MGIHGGLTEQRPGDLCGGRQREPRQQTKLAIEISYQVPDALIPFGAAVSPIVEQVLKTDLERFAVFASKVVSALGKRAGKG